MTTTATQPPDGVKVSALAAQLILDCARPLLHRLPIGSGTLYRMLGGYRESSAWARRGRRSVRGVDHGYVMKLDMANRVERETFYLGIFYEWELLHVLRHMVAVGDTFLDVGANIGMVTLCAARCTGKDGTILAFEPNPVARTRLAEHVAINALSTVRIVDKAVGDKPGTATLTVASDHTGTGTLRRQQDSASAYEVEVVPLDTYADQISADRRVFLKIDTEGFDFNVLRGARLILTRPAIRVFAEVNHGWLGELGQSAEEMFDYMSSLGFSAYRAVLSRKGLNRMLSLEPLSLPGPHHWFNALFLKDHDPVLKDLLP